MRGEVLPSRLLSTGSHGVVLVDIVIRVVSKSYEPRWRIFKLASSIMR